MHIEIAQAVEFLGRLLQSKLDSDVVNRFKETLTEILKIRFQDHWDPQQPFRGNGFRSLSNFNGQLDPILNAASTQAKVDPNSIHAHLPRDFVLWIDPFSVSYRVGDHGNIMTLFEDRSRGRVTLKLDPSNSPAPSRTNTPTTKSSASSPMMQFLQPRTSTPIRISPPNSPESIILKGQQKKPEDKSNKGLVMAV